MPSLSIRFADYRTLPKGGHGGQKDQAVVASAPVKRLYPAPCFVDHLEHVPHKQHNLTVSAFARKLPELTYLELNNAVVCHRWGVVSQNGDCYWSIAPTNMRDAGKREGFDPKPGAARMSYAYEDEQFVSGESIFLPINAPHLSHFFFQALPHLGQSVGGARKAFMRIPERAYFYDLLALLGYTREDTIFAPFETSNARTIWRFEKLIVPVFWATVHPLHESVFRIMGQLADPNPGSGRRIYISRADTRTHRYCLNEDEVCDLARAKGLEVVVCSSMSEVEKIATFRASEFVMGSVGSGMYNTIFSNRPTMMFALNGASYTDLMLRECASIANHPYGLHLCPEILSYDHGHQGMHNDYIADLSSLEQRLDGVLSALDQNVRTDAA